MVIVSSFSSKATSLAPRIERNFGGWLKSIFEDVIGCLV
jgi:hypothetical protein